VRLGGRGGRAVRIECDELLEGLIEVGGRGAVRLMELGDATEAPRVVEQRLEGLEHQAVHLSVLHLLSGGALREHLAAIAEVLGDALLALIRLGE